MTCIAAVTYGDKICMGADSAGIDASLHIVQRTDTKIFKNGPFLFGFTDSFRMGQLLRYGIKMPKINLTPKNIEKFMMTDFIEAIRECFKQGGYTTIRDNQEFGGEFLVGYKKFLFRIGGDFQVGCSKDGYDAVGCGGEYALGSLHSTNKSKDTPRIRVLKSLQAAEHFSAGVRNPFVIRTT
jgi:ATP-dependent protease HslVU (ClpYQ) peptidase subunit